MSISARGDREHCIRITTARQKNQCFRSLARQRARFDTRCSDLSDRERTRAQLVARMRAVTRADFDDNAKIPMKQGISAHYARRLERASALQSRGVPDRDGVRHEPLSMIDVW
jgi:hypothetical protein